MSAVTQYRGNLKLKTFPAFLDKYDSDAENEMDSFLVTHSFSCLEFTVDALMEQFMLVVMEKFQFECGDKSILRANFGMQGLLRF